MTSTSATNSRPTGQQYLARAIHAAGLSHVFVVPTALSEMIAELDKLGVECVVTHGEKSAAYMADAYARATKQPGVCFAQNIGASNLAAGLRDAYMACSPVIALTGGTTPQNSNRTVYQQIDDLSAFDSVTKMNVVVEDPSRLPELLRQAYRVATSGKPGPVHLRIPGPTATSASAVLEERGLGGPLVEPRFTQMPAYRSPAEADDLAQAIKSIMAAERPIIVAGGGVRISGAEAEILALARRMDIPVATSMNAKGCIDETDPLAVGVVGSYSRDSANMAVSASDLVVFIGSATGSQVTDNWRLPKPDSAVIQIDNDVSELGRHYPNQVGLLGDARTVLAQLLEIAPEQKHADWCATVANYVRQWRADTIDVRRSDARPIRPERLVDEMSQALPDDAILVCDTGHSGIWAASMIDMRPGQAFLRCAGSLGWAFSAAIGAAAAAPDRPVVAFMGDGGFYYHLSEIETAVRYGLNPIIVLNNNQAFSQNWKGFKAAFGGEFTEGGERLWHFHKVDFVAAVEALGGAAIRIEDPADLAGALKDAIAARKFIVLDVIGDPQALAAPPHGGQDFYASADTAGGKS